MVGGVVCKIAFDGPCEGGPGRGLWFPQPLAKELSILCRGGEKLMRVDGVRGVHVVDAV